MLKEIFQFDFDSEQQYKAYLTDLKKTDSKSNEINRILGEMKILTDENMNQYFKSYKWKFDLAKYISIKISPKDISNEVSRIIKDVIVELGE
jgi:hypothetical protein